MEVSIAITILLINVVVLVIIAVVLALAKFPPLVNVSTERFVYSRYESNNTLHVVSYAVLTTRPVQDINSVKVTAARFGVKDKVILPANNVTNLNKGFNYPNTRNFINLRYLEDSTDNMLHAELSLNNIGTVSSIAGNGASTLLTKTYKRALDAELSSSVFVTPSGIYTHRELAGARVEIIFLPGVSYSLRLKVGDDEYVEIAHHNGIGSVPPSPIMLFTGQVLALFNNTGLAGSVNVTKKTNTVVCNDTIITLS